MRFAKVWMTCSLALAGPAIADSYEDARELVQLMSPTTQTGFQLGQMMSEQFLELFKSRNPGREAELLEVINTEFQRIATERLADLEARMVDIYVDVLTEDELSGLIEFYKTDLGKALLEKSPELAIRGSQAGQQWGFEIGQEAAQKIIQELEAKGFDVDI